MPNFSVVFSSDVSCSLLIWRAYLVEDGRQLFAQEDGQNGGRRFIGSQTVAVSGTHDGGAQQVLVFVYHHQYVYQEGKEQHVPFRILARCKQIDTRIGAKRPVVVLAGAVHAVVGFS